MAAKERVLVTGAAGFIGSHLVERLLAKGCRPVGLDNFDPYYPCTLKEANLREAFSGRTTCFVKGDIRDQEFLHRLFSQNDIQTVVHLAARPGVLPSLTDPMTYFDINVVGTLSLLEACRSSGVRRFVFASSSSVYGENDGAPAVEDVTPCRPLSPYGASKAAAEQLCYTYSSLYALPTIVLRFFTVYGPRQRPDMAIRRFTELIDRGEEVPIFGDGSSRRDFTYITDIIDGVEAALEQPPSGFHVFNLGGSRPVELITLIELIQANLGKKARLVFQPFRSGEPTMTFADIAKAEAVLGFRPRVAIEDGIKRFVQWYREESRATEEIS